MESELDGLLLNRTGAGMYTDPEGVLYRLVPVDRAYSGKKAPRYYLQRLQEGRAQYISGVFQTNKPGIWSLDVRDELGVKIYFNMYTKQDGESLLIQRRKSEK